MPIAIHPEETIHTLYPDRRKLTADSTMRDKFDIRGSWLVSSQMEDVPLKNMLEYIVSPKKKTKKQKEKK